MSSKVANAVARNRVKRWVREAFRALVAEANERRQESLRDVLRRAAARWRGRASVHTHTPVVDPARALKLADLYREP